jgi:signal recognition particle receptor subunit beta
MAVYDETVERIVVHVVYDGPAFAGKTTNLERLCGFFTEHRRSKLFTTGNAKSRTVYLDWLQLEGGIIQGQKLRCQLITVPGQTVLARRRWHLLKRADVVVFVLDSTPTGFEEARPMFESMQRFALTQVPPVPIIVQANKQDQPGALDPAQIAGKLMLAPSLVVPASAEAGTGVRETTVLAIRAVADKVQKHVLSHGLFSLRGPSFSGEQIRAQIDAEERDNPQSPIEIVLSHGRLDALATAEPSAGAAEPSAGAAEPSAGAAEPSAPATALQLAAPEPSVTGGRRPASGKESPPLPVSAVPHGLIWPAATGRDLLRRVPLCDAEWRHDLAGQIGTHDGSGRSDTIIVEAGFWCLKTSPRRAYADADAARAALASLARRKLRLGALLAKNTVLMLQPDASDTYWMWTVSPWLTTLRASMSYAEKHGYVAALEESLVLFAAAALESLRLALEREIQLDVHPSNFARLGSRVYYVDDDITSGARLPSIGHSILRRVEEYAGYPQTVEVYLNHIVDGLKREFSRKDVASLGLEEALTQAIVSTSIGQRARSRLLEAAA